MNTEFILKNLLLPIAIGTISSYVTAYIHCYYEQKKYKTELLKEKYTNFYLPFVDLYNENVFGATNFTNMSSTLQNQFYLLIVKYEYRYTDEKLFDLIYCFKSAFNSDHSYNDYEKDLDDNFNGVVSYIFELQCSIRKELGY